MGKALNSQFGFLLRTDWKPYVKTLTLRYQGNLKHFLNIQMKLTALPKKLPGQKILNNESKIILHLWLRQRKDLGLF